MLRILTSLAIGLSPLGLTAQQPELHAPIGVQSSLDPDGGAPEDPGVPPRLLDDSNVDRFLRRAGEALARGDYRGAIPVLQDVVEGRTVEQTPGDDSPAPVVDDSRQAVFSVDGRIYRPVRRLSHEMLAALGPEAMTYYRARYEIAAERALSEALVAHDATAVEQVFERWFVTAAAADAMRLAGDLRMDQGAYRAALRDYRLLLDVYPEAARGDIDEVWLRFKVALCLQLAGDETGANREFERLLAESGDRSLRIEGELQRLTAIANRELFEDPGQDRAEPVTGTLFPERTETLVPLWEQRFVDPDPYRPAKGAGDRRSGQFSQESGPAVAPRFDQFAPGGQVLLEDRRIAFLDHFRLRLAGLPDGRALAATDGAERPQRPVPGQPRMRVAAYDAMTRRPVANGERIYAVIGPDRRRITGMEALLENGVAAWRRRDLQPLWSSTDDESFDAVTFLAAPTPVGDRLLVPTARGGIFGLDCLDARDGSLLFQVPLHAEGTELARPVTPPIAVEAGQAFMLSGAGVLAAVDASSGDLRWARRYERIHPFREAPRQARRRDDNQRAFRGMSIYREAELEGFAPSELVVHDGLVIAAPADSDLLLCLDAATGEPVWMLSRRDMQYLIGHDDQHLYFGAGDQVYCVALRSGLRLWRTQLPIQHRSREWRGRGTLAGDMLCLPGEEHLHLLSLQGERHWTSIKLAGFGLGRERMSGNFDVEIHGPWLVALYAGGLQVFSTDAALREMADEAEDGFARAGLLAHLGDLVGAVDALQSIEFDRLGAERPQVESRLLSLSGELALAMASHGDRDASLALLDRCRASLSQSSLQARWHLARIEVFRALGDLDAVAREQQILQQLGDGGSG